MPRIGVRGPPGGSRRGSSRLLWLAGITATTSGVPSSNSKRDAPRRGSQEEVLHRVHRLYLADTREAAFARRQLAVLHMLISACPPDGRPGEADLDAR
jgi:hypothetical protein